MIVLFVSRLVLYLTAVLVPALHPAVVVGYEGTGILVWFLLVPLEMLIGWYFAPPRLSLREWLAAAALPIAIVAIIIGIDANPLPTIIAGSLAFTLTAALFHFGPRVRVLFAIEQIVLATLYFRLLTYSRASEEVAANAAGATQLIFLMVIVAFLLHGIVVTLALAGGGHRPPLNSRTKPAAGGADGRRSRREVLVFLSIALPILLLAAFALPPDFVQHNPVVNLLGREVNPPPVPLDERADGLMDDGSLIGDGRTNRPGDQSGDAEGSDGDDAGQNGEYSLLGVEASDWSQGSNGSGEGEEEQRAVMVIASSLDPVYAADGYRDRFDTNLGFTYPDSQPLNDLVRSRLAGTWRATERLPDLMRREFSVNVYSTIPDRVLPYSPSSAEPTVYQPRYYPFSYSFHGSSRVSVAGRAQLARTRDLSASEADLLAPFLEVELRPEDEAAFRSHIAERIGEVPDGYHARIEAIMDAFRTFQYQIGFDDDFSTAHMARFVTETFHGDCVEFSNTAAILGRMLGIPSRVVTGYLATSSLQNPAHERGLAILRESLPQLSGYRLDEMYLVTTSHRHAWVQYYMPGYGWVDFEATSYAIPPPPGGDPNERRVVIPIIDPRELPRSAEFPWAQVGGILLWLGGATVVGLYLLRYGAELYLTLRARGSDKRAVMARYRLLLMRLASRGYELKPASMTAREYAGRFPEIAGFAETYTQIRYMPPAADRSEAFERLLDEYRTTSRSATNGRRYWRLTRLFSLRGLHYV